MITPNFWIFPPQSRCRKSRAWWRRAEPLSAPCGECSRVTDRSESLTVNWSLEIRAGQRNRWTQRSRADSIPCPVERSGGDFAPRCRRILPPALVGNRGRAPSARIMGLGRGGVSFSKGGRRGASRGTRPARGSSWTQGTVRAQPGRKHRGTRQGHGRGGPDGGSAAAPRYRPDRSSAKRDDAEFLLGLGTGYRTSLLARLTARPPRPCRTVPAPRCSSLSSPSIALPAASCPRVTPRDGHAGVTEGLACIRRSRRRDSSPRVVCFFSPFLNIWIVG